jgi:hypothetical protein
MLGARVAQSAFGLFLVWLVWACGGSTSTAGSAPEAGAPSSTSSGGSSGDGGSSGASSGGSSGAISSSGAPVGKMAFVVDRIYLGETDRTGVKNKDAWKEYGRDIDGLVSVVTSSTSPDLASVCKRKAGAAATVHNDGNGGIDNTWGKELLKLFDAFNGTPSQAMTGEIAKGGRTPMITLVGNSGSFVYAEAGEGPPTWAPTEERAVAADWMTGGVGGSPKATFVNGGVMTNGVYDSGPIAGDVLVGIYGQIFVPIRAARITMKIASDESNVTEGTISGVVETETMVNAFAAEMKRISTELCSGSTVEGIKESIRQASDIMQDGTQNPSVECNAISIAIGFDAKRVVVGAVAPAVEPPSDPCQ